MIYQYLGKSGLKVSRVCLGTMLFGGRTDEATAHRIIGRARDVGANFLDTADVYVNGMSEEIVGRAIAGDRDNWVLATKFGNQIGTDPNTRGLGRGWMERAIEASLKRLGTDYVDIYYLHHDFADTPVEETVAGMGALIRSGKIRYWGISNYRGWRIGEVVRVADALGVPRPIVSQPYYNLLIRMPEWDQLRACVHFGIGVVPYSPIARGVLSGKYRTNQPPPEDSRVAAQDTRMMETEWRPESVAIAEKVAERALARGMTTAQYAFLWVLNHAGIPAAVAGPRTEAQWEEYLGALDHAFTAEDEAFVSSLVPAGDASTPGYTDPRHPVEGRSVRTDTKAA